MERCFCLFSDGAVWYGKYSADQDGKKMTITDKNNGKTVTYEITETEPGASTKINVEGYGEANLKSVTKADFTKLAEDIMKSLNGGAAK